MCLMCANTFLFLHNTEEGPRSLCFKSFVNTTPIVEKIDFFTKWREICSHKVGGQLEFEIDQI